MKYYLNLNFTKLFKCPFLQHVMRKTAHNLKKLAILNKSCFYVSGFYVNNKKKLFYVSGFYERKCSLALKH